MGLKLPEGRADLLVWAQNFSTEFTANAVALGYTAPDATALAGMVTAYETALTNRESARAASRAATVALDDASDNLTNMIRDLVPPILINPAIPGEQILALGLTLPDPTRTTPGTPTNAPELTADISQRQQVTIGFKPTGTPNRAKPEGVDGCELFAHMGETNPGADGCQWLAIDSATPYIATFGSGDIGKRVFVYGRWRTRRGLVGPWSEVLAFTVPG